MTDTRIAGLLTEIFARGQHRLVFWNDADGSYVDQISTLVPAGVTLIRMDQEPALAIKHRLEILEPTKQFLLYAPTAEPACENDWLLDIRLYSKTFRADLASEHLDALGLSNAALHSHLTLRRPFLKSKARLDKLRQLVQSGDQAGDLDLKMLVVLTGADGSDLDSVVRALADGWMGNADCNLETENPVWNQIAALDLAPVFWASVKERYGHAGAQPSLVDLVTRLLMTDWATSCTVHDGTGIPQAMRHLVLPERTLWTNVAVLCSHWRSHQRRQATYQSVSSEIAKRIDLDRHLDTATWQTYLRVQTFESIERLIVVQIQRDLCRASVAADLVHLREAIATRRDGFWAGIALYQDILRGLKAAEGFLTLRFTYDHGFVATSLESLATAYTTDLFRFDQTYRHFMTAADAVEALGKDVLKTLRGRLEELYVDWYLPHLSDAWDAVVAKDRFLETGSIRFIPQQQRFFSEQVLQILKSNSRTRVFVVISDALRYEVGAEVATAINAEAGLVAELRPMISVVPSDTKLGMAALLPHHELRYSEDATQVFVDGVSSAGLEARAEILKKHQGMAISASDLISLKGTEAREVTKDARIIYVYHDRIDAIGDKQASETRTFAAAAETIPELANLIRFILKNCNTTNVFLTADHGFLYQDSASSKNAIGEKPVGTVLAKKRVLLGRNLGECPGVWHGSTKNTAGMSADGALEFWIPKGANRFHLVGGARFVHGGLMPQELLVPLLTIKGKRSDHETGQIRRVGISLLGLVNRVVNSRQRFEFIQTEPVSDKVLPRTVTVCLHDADQNDAAISDQITISLDSRSADVNVLKKTITLTVSQGISGKRPNVALVIRDADTQVEVQRFPMAVDIAFAAEF